MVIFFVGMITLQAQESLKVKFRSRALLDATLSGYGKESTQGYYRLEDFRMGFKATYQKFEVKADIGLGGGKVAIKDLLLNYHSRTACFLSATVTNPFRWICLSVPPTCVFISRQLRSWRLPTAGS